MKFRGDHISENIGNGTIDEFVINVVLRKIRANIL